MRKSVKPFVLCLGVMFTLGSACTAGMDVTSQDKGAGAGNASSGSDQSPNIPGTNDPFTDSDIPFAPITMQASARKVKALLTGLAVTDDEYTSLNGDTSRLADMISDWQKTPGYQKTMQQFFANAFQQNMTTQRAYRSARDGLPGYPLFLSTFRDSFPLTVVKFMNDGTPFNQVASTRTFMMTTYQMMVLAVNDMNYYTSNTSRTNQFQKDNPNFVLKFQDTDATVTSAQTLDAKSEKYGQVYYKGLKEGWPTGTGCPPYNGEITFASDWLTTVTQAYLNSDKITFTLADKTSCTTTNYGQMGFRASDANDWRMVTVRQAGPNEQPDSIFAADRLRQGNTLVLRTPTVGYFTTLPFLALWATNKDNQARVTINQTLIVGLGEAFDGGNGLQAGILPGLDAEHADPTSACFSCHRNLDPMREFFWHDMNLYWSPQKDPNHLNLLPTWAFNSGSATKNSLYDLGDQIANSPDFAAAWTMKLCAWANSRPCLKSDPEIVRVANVFAASNFNWNTLVKELMTSPLVTYQSETQTSLQTSGIVSLARRNHFCNVLNQRLGMVDACGQANELANVTSSTLTTAYPADGIIRGSEQPFAPTAPAMPYRMTLENVCIKTALAVIDKPTTPSLKSSDPNTAIRFLAHDLMGLSDAEAQEPQQMLMDLYTSVLADATADKTNTTYTPAKTALMSAFVVACVSPMVSSIGF